jgi:hypothetical protein
MEGVRKNTFSSAQDTRRKYLFSFVTGSIPFLEMYVTPGRRVWLKVQLWIQSSIYCGIKIYLYFVYWYVFYIRYKAVLSQESNNRNYLRKMFIALRFTHNHNLHVYFSCRPASCYTLESWVCSWLLVKPV